MRGLALEGGGARGAYHIGVVKALMESGYEFGGFTGTSIGAVNAAMFAQGDFDIAEQLWLQISPDRVFDDDEKHLFRPVKISELRADKQLPVKIREAVAKVIANKGVNTVKMRAFLETYINEDKLRGAGKDFGLVTVSVNEFKPYQLMLGDIPYGQVVNYIMASASFPGFRPENIGGQVFIDGALYDNCPFNLLLDKGYEEIIAVRTNAPGIIRKAADTERVKVISPSEDLGNLMWFSPENCGRNISIGYIDGLSFVSRL